jgi:hypothetical protein
MLHDNGLDACRVAHTSIPAVEKHPNKIEKMENKHTPVNCNDEHGNKASVHKLVDTELLTPKPFMNNAGVHSRPPPWPNQQLKLIA